VRAGSDIQYVRKSIETAMEQRRQTLEVTRVRKGQVAARHRDQRDAVLSMQQHGGLTARASQQLQDLHKIHGNVTHTKANVLLESQI
jgi:hypothetical protein